MVDNAGILFGNTWISFDKLVDYHGEDGPRREDFYRLNYFAKGIVEWANKFRAALTAPAGEAVDWQAQSKQWSDAFWKERNRAIDAEAAAAREKALRVTAEARIEALVRAGDDMHAGLDSILDEDVRRRIMDSWRLLAHPATENGGAS